MRHPLSRCNLTITYMNIRLITNKNYAGIDTIKAEAHFYINKIGQETTSKVDCPYVTLGTYAFTLNDVDTGSTVTCSGNAVDMCTDNTEMTFDYSCASNVAYSG